VPVTVRTVHPYIHARVGGYCRNGFDCIVNATFPDLLTNCITACAQCNTYVIAIESVPTCTVPCNAHHILHVCTHTHTHTHIHAHTHTHTYMHTHTHNSHAHNTHTHTLTHAHTTHLINEVGNNTLDFIKVHLSFPQGL